MITTLLTAGAFAVAALNSATPAQVSNNVTSTKVVTLSCPKTWRGSAGGTFGGVSFSVSCASNNDLVILEGVVGNDYTVRMGSEQSATGAFDCFWSGSGDSLIVRCGKVRLAIR
jgi:hypothetical protein